MPVIKRFGHMTAMLALAGILIPVPRLCGQESLPAGSRDVSTRVGPRVISDVELQPGGILRGRVIDADGQPVPKVTLQIFRGSQLMGSAQTGAGGQFAVGSLRGGVYRVTAARVTGVLRLWAAHTAPPKAKPRLWIVSGPVARAQMHPAAALMGSPYLFTGLVAAVAVIPVAIHNNRSDRRSGS